MSASRKELKINDCWNQIGVWSKTTEKCSILKQVVHCQNCNVYSEAGRNLLNQETPEGYQNEWRDIYQNEKAEINTDLESIIVFRLGHEWFGLPIDTIDEITDISKIHTIPHRRNKVIRGLVNIRGTLQVCISVGTLFNLSKHDKELVTGRIVHERMMVLQREQEKYAFPVSEVHNIKHYAPDTLKNPPATISRATSTFIRGVLEVDDTRVGVIDAELLFHAIQRNMI